MKRLKLLFVFLLSAIFFINSNAEPWRHPFISMINLVANPAEYQDQKIFIKGFVYLEKEGSAVYVHRDDFKYGIVSNGFSLNFSCRIDEKIFKDFSEKYAIVVGKFDSLNKGNLYAGTIYVERLTIIDPELDKKYLENPNIACPINNK